MEVGIFDHALLCLKENEHIDINKSHFKFLNILTYMEGFLNEVDKY